MTHPKGTDSPGSETSGPADYVDIAIEYARAAVRDRRRKHFGKWIRLAAIRFLRDLKRAEQADCAFRFDREAANKPCEFIECLPHVEGSWSSATIELHPSHVFFVVQLFGFRDRLTGARRFTSALFAVARKNAKSTLAAAILIYCECCERENGAQLISAATTFPQAAIIFRIAKQMVERTPELREAFGLEVFAKSIARYETGSSFKPIHAKASTQDGLNPSHTALDEIHAHKTADLLNVLTSAAGGRANPLWLYTTTEGYANPGPWSELRDFVQKLLKGVFGHDADHFLVAFFAVDDDDKEFDEAAWPKANPLLDVNPHLLAAIRKEAVEAKAMSSKLSEFRIKRLNRQASVAQGFIDLPRWKRCGGEADLATLVGVNCWGGLDLATSRDMCAWRLVWIVDDLWLTWGRYWVPEAAVAMRTERKTVPYQSWVDGGHVTMHEGDTVDYLKMRDDILEDCDRFAIQELAFDPWNATETVQHLQAKGLPMVEFRQGAKSFHPAINELERVYVSGRLRHAGNPVLHWNASNLVLTPPDENLNRAPSKKRSADKIDGMVALLMGVGRALASIGSNNEIPAGYSLTVA